MKYLVNDDIQPLIYSECEAYAVQGQVSTQESSLMLTV